MGRIKTIASAAVIIACSAIIAVTALDTLDKNIYPGCKVLDQQANVLIIELDPEFDEPTDITCNRFGQLIYRITQDGYQVQVHSGHFAGLGVITKEKARKLAEGY